VLTVVLFLFLGVALSIQFLWVVPLILLLFIFTVGLALFLSCANLFFRDVKYIVQVLLTFGIFFTPVLYEPANLGALGCQLMMLNPLTPILEGLRLAIVDQQNLFHSLAMNARSGETLFAWHPGYLLYAAAWSLGGFLGAWFLFHKLEYLYAEYI
jgi:ABC-type polysaccharide/polyol phosphate export permease